MGGSDQGDIGVLIVDDQLMFTQSLARLLDDEPGIDVLGIAVDGVKAIDFCQHQQPDVVLADYHLPDLDGVHLASALKAIDPRIKIVILTGLAKDSVLVAAIDVGCSGFLTKDQAASEVASAVRSAAAGEVLMSPMLMTRLLRQLRRASRGVGADLTERERELLVLLAQGKSNTAIAEELHLSIKTIRNYLQHIFTKLDSHSKIEAVTTAVREGIIEFPFGS
jgi:DNA-binding NarL/FixJ family response regulator